MAMPQRIETSYGEQIELINVSSIYYYYVYFLFVVLTYSITNGGFF